MDELEKFRAFLGSAARGYSDAQLNQLRCQMHAMAELLLDIYLHKKRNETRSPGHNLHFDRLRPPP